MKQKSIGYLEIIVAVSIWALSSGILVRWISQGAIVLYGVGAMAGAFFVLLYLFLTKRISEIQKSYIWRKELFWIGLFIGLNNGLFFLALKTTTIANAIITHYFAPIVLVLIFAPLVLRQKIRKQHIFATVLGFIGLIVVFGSQIGNEIFDVGIILGLASAVFFAWHTAIESKLATNTKIDPLVEVLYKNGVPALMFLPFVIGEIAENTVTMIDFSKLIFYGILVLGISFILVYRGLAKVSSQSASVLFYGEPIGAIILAWIVWNESLNASVVLGGSLVLLAGYLATKNKG